MTDKLSFYDILSQGNLQTFIDTEPDKLKSINESGNTILHTLIIYSDFNNLVQYGSINMVRMLIPVLDINIPNKRGLTPLHLTLQGKEGIANVLLEAGANVNIKCVKGYTPLCYSFKNFRNLSNITSHIETLLRARADPNIQNNKGKTPIYYAIKLADVVLTKLLLSFGADLHISYKKGKTIYDMALKSSSKKIRNLVNQYPKVLTLRTMCLITIDINKVDISEQPPLLFIRPDEVEENKGYLERTN